MVAQAGPRGEAGAPVGPQEPTAEVALIFVLSPTTVAHVDQIAQAGWDGPVLAVGSVEEARELLDHSSPSTREGERSARDDARPAREGGRHAPYRPSRPQLLPAPDPRDRPRGLVLDPDRRKVVHSGHERTLTPLEFGVLEVLMQRPGQVQHFAELTRLVWGTTFTGDSAHLHAVVRRLRRKLEGVRAPVELVAVRGVGFRLSGVAPVDDPRTARPDVGDVPWVGSVASS